MGAKEMLTKHYKLYFLMKVILNFEHFMAVIVINCSSMMRKLNISSAISHTTVGQRPRAPE